MPEKKSVPFWAYPLAIGGGVLALWYFAKRRDQSNAEGRRRFWELYDRDAAFPGANLAELDKVRARLSALSRAAVEIQAAAGVFNDDEGMIAGAFRQVRSRFELYWLNRVFSYLFPNPSAAPQLGAWLDQRLTDEEWIPIVQTLDALPKFAPTVNGCTHAICGTCGGLAQTVGDLDVFAVCSPKCLAATGDVCECKCGGKFHRAGSLPSRERRKPQGTLFDV